MVYGGAGQMLLARELAQARNVTAALSMHAANPLDEKRV
jgi:hypothetical protein